VPVGKPIDNAIVAILDDNKRIVPPGVTGLIYIGGVPLSMGYETEDGSDSFVNVPIFGRERRLFKTGDRGYLSDEFDLVICGREDGQLKINGQRLSAQEIEAVLRQIDGVSDSIVMLEERSGKHFLIAYLEVKGILREEDILIKLNKTLPLFMHPKEYYVVGEFPKLSGGKIDKISLGKMALATNRLKRSSDGDFPLTANERYIFDVLEKLLKTEVISRFDTLYSLGADSMTAVEFLNEIEKKGKLDVPPQLILTQTVFSLAEKYQAIQEVPLTCVSNTTMR
jgi:acyl carrier protein